jgi:hypothetical protein
MNIEKFRSENRESQKDVINNKIGKKEKMK